MYSFFSCLGVFSWALSFFFFVSCSNRASVHSSVFFLSLSLLYSLNEIQHIITDILLCVLQMSKKNRTGVSLTSPTNINAANHLSYLFQVNYKKKEYSYKNSYFVFCQIN